MAKIDVKLTSVELSSKLTVRELKDYIRSATGRFNKQSGFKRLGSPVKQSMDYLRKNIGTRRGGELKFGFSGKNKSDLLKQARLLKAHLNISLDYENRKKAIDDKTRKAYEQFKKNTGIDMPFEDYQHLVKNLGGIKDIIEQLDSDQIADLYDAYRSEPLARSSLFDIIRETYNEMSASKTGFMQEEFYDRIIEKLEELIY